MIVKFALDLFDGSIHVQEKPLIKKFKFVHTNVK